jgi:hypothetical protein
MSDFDEFKSHYALAEKLMAAMTRERLADCLRILALHVGDYRLRFREIPGQDFLGLLGTTEISAACSSPICTMSPRWSRSASTRAKPLGVFVGL